MAVVIRIVGLANGQGHAFEGRYIKYWDVNYLYQGRYDGGYLKLTRNIDKAQRYLSAEDAMLAWKAQAPEPYHLRPDGEANRPLTAFTVEVLPVESFT